MVAAWGCGVSSKGWKDTAEKSPSCVWQQVVTLQKNWGIYRDRYRRMAWKY